MSTTVVAQLITADGQNVRTDIAHMRLRHKSWAIPALEVRNIQAPQIPLRLEHGGPAAGRITHLERRAADGSLWCVAELDDDIWLDPNRNYYLSVEATWNETGPRDIEIRGAALCHESAMIGLAPATLVRRNGLDHRGEYAWRTLGRFENGLLENAKDAQSHRRRGDPIEVRDWSTQRVAYAKPPQAHGQTELSPWRGSILSVT